jgi:3-phosphoshikimate 1-carboxyvinyltransferase
LPGDFIGCYNVALIIPHINPHLQTCPMENQLSITPFHSLHGVIGPRGRYALPGDKSLSHRAALLAALATGDSRIENFLVSGTTIAMLNALAALKVPWKLTGTTLAVRGRGMQGFISPPAPIDCGNSATTLRLLAGALAGAGVAATLDGSPGLRKRPMARIIEPLHRMGASIDGGARRAAPLILGARPPSQPLTGIDYTLPVASAQVKSALLLAALSAGSPTTLREPGPSRDHTERMLTAMGVSLETWIAPDDSLSSGLAYFTRLTPPQRQNPSTFNLKPLNLYLPCDFSSAAFLIVAALITPGSEITIQGVGLNPTRTGLLDALQEMGADIDILPGPDQGGEPFGDLVVRSSPLHACEVTGDLVVRMIDEFPVFAVAAAYAEGDTLVSEAEELRYKESDRIGALCAELSRLGVKIDETQDGFIVRGGRPLNGGEVNPHGDHRLAMALVVAGLAARGRVHVQEAEIIGESFPEFVPILQALGAKITN